MEKLLLLPCHLTHIKFEDTQFDVVQCDNEVTIAKDDDNYVVVTLKNQQVAYKANMLGGFTLSEEVFGNIDYKPYFRIEWEDDQSIPQLAFNQKPTAIHREYQKGMKIELGIEDFCCYHVVYSDQVTANFTRTDEAAYDFKFSTGFNGSLWKDPDGSHLIRFKGIRLDAEEDGYESESKFIISRSKYTDNLILILQDDATVYLRPLRAHQLP